MPSHIPVPCICGHAASHTGGGSSWSPSASSSSTLVGGVRPEIDAPKPAIAIGKMPCVYMTPFGMPVVPPV